MALPPSSIGEFTIGDSPIGGVPEQLNFLPQPWSPAGPTTALNIIPAYLYVEHQDDDNVRAFFDAYNNYAQGYLDYLNGLDLPVYTGANINGPLLDWIAECLYGISRPGLPQGATSPPAGPYNSDLLNQVTYNTEVPGRSATYYLTNDDVFKRVITWAFYKGDGKVFNPFWLKRRIRRFLYGANGADIINDITYDVSVAPTAAKAWTITVPAGQFSNVFQAAVAAGVLELPFQITWTVTVL